MMMRFVVLLNTKVLLMNLDYMRNMQRKTWKRDALAERNIICLWRIRESRYVRILKLSVS